MPSELEKKLEKAKIEFQDKTRREITKQFIVPINKNGKIEKILVKKSKTEAALRKISTGGIPLNAENFLRHFNDLSRYLPLCSSPKSFIESWEISEKNLDNETADKLSNYGAQFIQINNDDTERIFRFHRQGLQLGENKGLLFALRHSKGKYADVRHKIGYILYDPPTNVSGFFQYRWSQYLREKFDIPIIVLLVRWFKYKIRENYNHVVVIAPAAILSKEEQNDVGKSLESKNDLKNLSKTLGRPLPLKIISREDAYELIYELNTLGSEKSIIKNRSALSSTITSKWSFTNISNHRSQKLKLWAKTTGKKCPDGRICKNKRFDSIPFTEIAFGHIISQNWGKAFKFPLNVIHHPDNLYLTCQRCNSSLNSNFPHQKLQEKIHGDKLTIGDWLRANRSLQT